MLAPAWSSRPLSLRTVRPSAFLGPPGPCWELGSQVAQSRPTWMVSVPPQGLGCGRRPGQSGLVQRLGFAVADTFLTGLRAPWQSSGRVRMAEGTLESLSPSGPPVCTSPSSSDAGAGLRQLGGGRGLRVSRCSDRVSGRVAGWQLLRPGLDPSCSPARLRAFFSVHRPAALRPPGAQQRQDSTAREAGGKTAPGGGAGGGAAPGALAARALSSRRVLRTPALTPCFSFPLSFSACRQRGLRSGAHELQTLPSRSPQGSSVALTHLLKFVKISSEICCHLSAANTCLHLIPPASCLSVLRYLVTWLPCSLSSLKGSFHRLSSMLLCWGWERDSFSILYS